MSKPLLTPVELSDSLLAIIRARNGVCFNSLRTMTAPLVDFRAVDRELQKLRKAGKIRFAGPKTGWVAT